MCPTCASAVRFEITSTGGLGLCGYVGQRVVGRHGEGHEGFALQPGALSAQPFELRSTQCFLGGLECLGTQSRLERIAQGAPLVEQVERRVHATEDQGRPVVAALGDGVQPVGGRHLAVGAPLDVALAAVIPREAAYVAEHGDPGLRPATPSRRVARRRPTRCRPGAVRPGPRPARPPSPRVAEEARRLAGAHLGERGPARITELPGLLPHLARQLPRGALVALRGRERGGPLQRPRTLGGGRSAPNARMVSRSW